MREILFKAKRKNWHDLPKEQWWVEGYYVSDKWYLNDNIIHAIIPTNAYFYPHCEIEYEEIDLNTLCQYTGLTDKNGVKIWENNVIRYKDDIINKEKIDLIEYNETHASFVRLHKSKMGLQYLYINEAIAGKCEVIGNIFDNPELLEVADE